MKYYKSKVVHLHQAIPNARTLTLEVDKSWNAEDSYLPGQFILVKAHIKGKEVQRAYSIHAYAQNKERIQISVKGHKDGQMSSFLNQVLQEGDELQISDPKGRFVCHPDGKHYKTYYFFAAGSGITPVYAMIQQLLLHEPNSVVYLLYGNRKVEDILFLGELNYLDIEHKDRFEIRYMISDAYWDWQTLFDWEGKAGRINEKELDLFLQSHPPYSQDCEYYICGRETMNKQLRNHLLSLEVEAERIHTESYGRKPVKRAEDIVGTNGLELEAKVYDAWVKVKVDKDETLLEALKRSNKPPRHSCESGICGSCAGRVEEGEVEMRSNSFLSEKEVAKGKFLSCQAIQKSSFAKVKFE